MLNDGGHEARKDRDKDVDIRLMQSALQFCQTCKEQGWKFSTLQEAAVSELFDFYWVIKIKFLNGLVTSQKMLRRLKTT